MSDSRGMIERESRRLSGALILHGFTANLESVRELFTPLGALDLKLSAPLLRGHGGPSPDHLRGVTWRDWLADTEGALKALTGSEGKAVVIGHSLGAILALQLAGRYPELVDSVVLATTPLRITSVLAPGRPLNFLAPLVSRLIDRWDFSPTFADPADAIMPKQYDWVPTRTILSMFELLHETERVMGRVRTPALILHGRHETVVRPESAGIVYRSIATPPENKSIVWFERTDHQIFCDCERRRAIESVVSFVEGRLAATASPPAP